MSPSSVNIFGARRLVQFSGPFCWSFPPLLFSWYGGGIRNRKRKTQWDEWVSNDGRDTTKQGLGALNTCRGVQSLFIIPKNLTFLISKRGFLRRGGFKISLASGWVFLVWGENGPVEFVSQKKYSELFISKHGIASLKPSHLGWGQCWGACWKKLVLNFEKTCRFYSDSPTGLQRF